MTSIPGKKSPIVIFMCQDVQQLAFSWLRKQTAEHALLRQALLNIIFPAGGGQKILKVRAF